MAQSKKPSKKAAKRPPSKPAPSKPDLKAIEDRLNKDAAMQKAFLANPVQVLRKEGVALSREAASDLRSLVKDLGTPEAVARRRPKIRITISIRIRF